jgi:hypothetical protein
MDTAEWLHAARHTVGDLRDEYAAAGRGPEFDLYVAGLRADDRWPFPE